MINYELAKKLKDAGFSQDYHDCVGDRSGNCICENNRIIRDVTIPTLSELIEACGEEFRALVKGSKGFATSESEKTGWHGTPEEAVANLWLSFNKK